MFTKSSFLDSFTMVARERDTMFFFLKIVAIIALPNTNDFYAHITIWTYKIFFFMKSVFYPKIKNYPKQNNKQQNIRNMDVHIIIKNK